jgi:hypothetical protein
MAAKPKQTIRSRSSRPDGHYWRRFALSVPVSLLAHLVLVFLMRPQYKAVSDYAVELDVIDMSPERPEPAVKPEAVPAPEPEPAPKPEPTPKPKPVSESKPKAKTEPTVIAASKEQALGFRDAGLDGGMDGGPAVAAVDGGIDSGTSGDVVDAGGGDAVDAGGGDAGGSGVGTGALKGTGKGGGGGVCMHDLFGFTAAKPRWMLWISLESFRETVYQRSLGSVLASYGVGRRMVGATGFSPASDIEGLLVTADNIFDSRTFGIVASYDIGEETLRGRLTKLHGRKPGFTWVETPWGWEAFIPGEFRWQLVGSGRVLRIVHEPPLLKPQPAAIGLSTDAGVKESSADAPAKSRTTALDPVWPRQVTCLSAKISGVESPKPPPPTGDGLKTLVNSTIAPNPEGHWPVAVLATSDPRAVGLGRRAGKQLQFEFAVVRAYFTNPVHIEGRFKFKGHEKEIAALADKWRAMAKKSSKDPFFAMAGLGRLFDGLVLEVIGDEMRFTMRLTEGQVRAALVFLELQGEALEKQLRD